MAQKVSQSSSSAESVATQNNTSDSQKETSSYTVYVTKTGSKYHRAGCRYLSQSQIAIDKEKAVAQGYSPCSVCNP